MTAAQTWMTIAINMGNSDAQAAETSPAVAGAVHIPPPLPPNHLVPPGPTHPALNTPSN